MALVRKRLGCCTAPVAGFGADLTPADSPDLIPVGTAAATPAVGAATGLTAGGLFGVSVAAGITVWLATKFLSKR